MDDEAIYDQWLEGLDIIEAFLNRDEDVTIATSIYAIAHTATGGVVDKPHLMRLLVYSLMATELIGTQLETDYNLPPLQSEIRRFRAAIELSRRSDGRAADLG